MSRKPRMTYHYAPTGDIQKDAEALARFANGDLSDVKCTVCGARYGGCSCWKPCGCGWSHLEGETCANPIHDKVAIFNAHPSGGKSLACPGAIGVPA